MLQQQQYVLRSYSDSITKRYESLHKISLFSLHYSIDSLISVLYGNFISNVMTQEISNYKPSFSDEQKFMKKGLLIEEGLHPLHFEGNAQFIAINFSNQSE